MSTALCRKLDIDFCACYPGEGEAETGGSQDLTDQLHLIEKPQSPVKDPVSENEVDGT